MHIDFHKRRFSGVTNSPNGQVSGDTIFQYEQYGQQINGTYQGGSILRGHLLGILREDGRLEFVYHHEDTTGNLRSGHCISIPEILPDGRIRLYERWKWDYGGEGEGESVVEEI